VNRISLDKAKIKILLLEGVHQTALAAFHADGYTQIEYHPKSLPQDQLIESIRDAYFIGIRSNTRHTAAILE